MKKRRQIDRAKRSRAQILAAALKLFSRVGYHGTSLRDIARAAKASTGNVYHHFPDKEAIFTALIEGYLEVGFSKFVVRPMATPSSWRAELEELAGAVGDLQT